MCSKMQYKMKGTEMNNSSKIFFFNDTATTEIYTLALHDALPICFLYCQFLVAAAPHFLY